MIILFSILWGVCSSYKFLILNDIHYHPNYTSTCQLCVWSNLGQYGQDSPLELIEYMTDHAKDSENNLDAILVNGDFIRHGFGKNDKKADDLSQLQKWE
jgi:hypothetical protein